MLGETKSINDNTLSLSNDRLDKINNHNRNENEKNEIGIFINNIVARWTKEIQEPTLDNITAFVQPGQLLGVIGSVGSGKVTN